MKILFLTRKYPPQKGGMENFSYNLIDSFKKINKDTFVIANTEGNKYLPIFTISSFFKSLSLIKKNKITHLHLGDGIMSFEGKLIKKLTGVKTIITIHGLDITYNNWLYQKIIPNSINKADKIICVSNFTKEQCIKRGINKNKISVIPNGVNPEEFIIKKSKDELRKELRNRLNLGIKDKKVLLTTGRLVKRKGVAWFTENVMTKLNENYIYLVVGEGKERENIENAIAKNKLKNRVILLGKVDDIFLKLLYNSSDLLIMPNISVKDNPEGFGIVAIEAGSCGLQVIASKIDGITDAIINGKTGWLVKEKDTEGFISKINSKPLSKDSIIKTVKDKFDWKVISKEYLEEMR